jgi:hypothetical protein
MGGCERATEFATMGTPGRASRTEAALTTGAETRVGFLYFEPSCHMYSYLQRAERRTSIRCGDVATPRTSLAGCQQGVGVGGLFPRHYSLVAARHFGARLWGAEVRYCAVDQVDSVEKVDDMHRVPLVVVLVNNQGEV